MLKEKYFLRLLQHEIAQEVMAYMKSNEIGFNELSRQLNCSASHLIKIKAGEANLTLATIARIATLIKKQPSITFKQQET